MFNYAYSLAGDADTASFDYNIDTVTNTPSQGDAVLLVSGKLQKAQPASTKILGIMDGSNFKGINLSPVVGKVKISPLAVFRVDYVGTTKTSLADTDIGSKFDLSDAHTLNLDATTVGQWEVVGYDNANKKAYVKLNATVEVVEA